MKQVKELLYQINEWKEEAHVAKRHADNETESAIHASELMLLSDVESTVFHLWRRDGESLESFLRRVERES